MTLVAQPTIGLEEVQRQAFFVLFDNLNETLEIIGSYWDTKDQEFAQHTGREYVQTILEPIQPGNFVEGHAPSLINAPIDRYPNCSVMAYQTTPGAGHAAFDQIDVYRNVLYVDVMVRSDRSEEEVNRRIHRLVEATNIVLQQHETLNGIVSGHEDGPSITLGDVFTKKERTAYGPHWFWQGARLTYAVRKEAQIPSASASSGSIFRTQYPDADIDQA